MQRLYLVAPKVWNKGRQIAQNVYVAELGIRTQLGMCKYACEELELSNSQSRRFYEMVSDMIADMIKAGSYEAVREHMEV